LVPRRFKDRFRRVASWPAEQERRSRTARLAALAQRVRNGEFPDSSNPTVTVVIPCFEQGQWIEDAIHSVFAQTFDSWEIVVVDDGSTDPGTVRILDDLGTWSRIILVRQENRGLAAARNAGVARARGEFVVPLDADDELMPAYLGEMVAALSPHPEAAFAHCWARLFGDVDAVWVPRPFNRYWQRLSNGVVGCVLLRKAAWAAVGGYDETMRRGHEDWELWLRLDAAGWSQVRVNQVLFRYRKHGVSMSVRSEAGFETGLAEIRARHPDLYARAALEDVKHEWYPLVSLIVDGDTQMSVSIPPDVTAVSAAESAIGKYVADVRGRSCDPDAIVRLARDLEQDSEKAAAVGTDGLVVWRRWALMDPGADLRGILGADRVPVDPLTLGCLADQDWVIDPTLIPAGVRVLRQRPEEPGSLPGWVVA
jgi:GT2 family glycosyltransferase